MRLIYSLVMMFLAVSASLGAEKADAFAPLPKGFSSFGAAVVDDFVYVYGGHAGKPHTYSKETILGEFRRLNLKNPAKWEDLTPGPGLQGLAVVAHNGSIYRIGGMQPQNKEGDASDIRSQTGVAKYDTKTKKWEEITPLPEPRSSHDAVVVDDRIFVFGGWNLRGPDQKPVWYEHGVMLNLNDPAAKWEPIKQPFQRRALTMAAFDNKVYAVAGMDAEGGLSPTINIFDPKAANWTEGPSVPGSRMTSFTPATAVAGGRLFLSGHDGKLYRMTEKKDEWEIVGKLQQARFVHRMVAAGDELLVNIGGASKDGNVTLTEGIVPTKTGEAATREIKTEKK